eukprot:GDKK01025389.1.p1 GENE.GDKK01025389.1~~GDKK01025389.1.p1  ORF type:complete len:242 (+),score=37.19 GDKK01025389.1:139-864(+)
MIDLNVREKGTLKRRKNSCVHVFLFFMKFPPQFKCERVKPETRTKFKDEEIEAEIKDMIGNLEVPSIKRDWSSFAQIPRAKDPISNIKSLQKEIYVSCIDKKKADQQWEKWVIQRFCSERDPQKPVAPQLKALPPERLSSKASECDHDGYGVSEFDPPRNHVFDQSHLATASGVEDHVLFGITGAWQTHQEFDPFSNLEEFPSGLKLERSSKGDWRPVQMDRIFLEVPPFLKKWNPDVKES